MVCVADKKSGSKARILPECAALLDPNEDSARAKDLNTDLKCELGLYSLFLSYGVILHLLLDYAMK
jgi:hypothetical protein